MTLADSAFALLTTEKRAMTCMTVAAYLNRLLPDKNKAASYEVYRELANDPRFTQHRSVGLTTFSVAP